MTFPLQLRSNSFNMKSLGASQYTTVPNMKCGSLNLFKERTGLKKSPVGSASPSLFSLSDTLACQFQKLNIKFCYFSLILNQDPCVEDVPEVKGFPADYEKDSNHWLQCSHWESKTNLLRISFVGAISKQNVNRCFFPLLFLLTI